MDIFENPILCKDCKKQMKRTKLSRNGFIMRAVICEDCGNKVLHPSDEQEYEKFKNLKKKEYRVKMRMVGNSYAVSIPKEIVSFIKEQEKIMDDMVGLCFEDFGSLSLNFNKVKAKEKEKKNG